MRIFLHSLSFDALDLPNQKRNLALQDELDLYCQRSILLASKEDLVILSSPADQNYLSYLSKLGFGLGKHLYTEAQGSTLAHKVLNDHNLVAHINGLPLNRRKLILYPYFSGDDEWELAGNLGATVFGGKPSLTRELNNKVFTRNFFLKLGVTLPEGTSVSGLSVLETASQYFDQFHSVIVRGEKSCGGSSIWVIKNQCDWLQLKNRVNELNDSTQFLVERLYEIVSSPNHQFLINQKGITFIGASEQVLNNDMSHVGNHYPANCIDTDTIHNMSKHICNALRGLGYQGIAGIDYIIDENNNVMPVELNARFNTSSFAFIVLRRLFGAAWKSKYFELLHSVELPNVLSFNDLQDYLDKNILFDLSRGTGVFPYNTGLLKWNRCDMIIIGDDWEEITKLKAIVAGLASRRLSENANLLRKS